MVRGLSYSLIIHSIVLLIIGLGLPALFDREREVPFMAISVEIVPIKDISNLPQSQKPVKKEETQAQQEQKKPQPQKPVVQETKPEQPDEATVPLPKDIKKPEEKKEEEKPKEKVKPKKPKKPVKEKDITPKKKDDAFDQLLKDLTEQSDSETPKKDTKKAEQSSAKSKSDRYDPTIPLSLSEKDAIRSQFAKYWRLPAGVRDDYTLAVEIRVLVNPDGSVKQAGIAKHHASRYRSDSAFRAAADSALRAVKLASPLRNLPVDKYSTWKDMVVNFDPKEMLY